MAISMRSGVTIARSANRLRSIRGTVRWSMRDSRVRPMPGMASMRSANVTSLPKPALLTRVSVDTRPGSSTSICIDTAPPRLLPMRWTGRVSPSASRVAHTPSDRVTRLVEAGWRWLRPKPGMSMLITRCDSDSRGCWADQSSRLRPMPCSSTTGGADSSPLASYRIRASRTST
jgi:hypothetical protein